jgi:hypothetical protein
MPLLAEFEPFQGFLQCFENLDFHASMHSNGFAVLVRITNWLMENISKPRNEFIFLDKLASSLRRECSVEKALKLSRLSL